MCDRENRNLESDARGGRRCIVCGTFSAYSFASVDTRRYDRCETCHATFLDPEHRLSIDEEHARYRLH